MLIWAFSALRTREPAKRIAPCFHPRKNAKTQNQILDMTTTRISFAFLARFMTAITFVVMTCHAQSTAETVERIKRELDGIKSEFVETLQSAASNPENLQSSQTKGNCEQILAKLDTLQSGINETANLLSKRETDLNGKAGLSEADKLELKEGLQTQRKPLDAHRKMAAQLEADLKSLIDTKIFSWLEMYKTFSEVAGPEQAAEKLSLRVNEVISAYLPPKPKPTPTLKPTPKATPTTLPEIVASVNGEIITREQLLDVFKVAQEASDAKAADLTNEQKLGAYNQLLQELIMDKLVSVAASGEKVTDAEVDAEITKIKKQFPNEKDFAEQLKQAGQPPEKLKENLRTMLQQQLWMKSQVTVSDVSEAQAEVFYDANKKEFEQPETVKASHILFMLKPNASKANVSKQKEAATKAFLRASQGEDFSALARELSEEPGAKESSGDLGFFTKDRMVPEFANVAFAQEVGDISKPVRTQFGWHIIKVTSTKPAGIVPFPEVKDQITAYLKSNSQREAVQAVLKKLKGAAKIETFLPSKNEN